MDLFDPSALGTREHWDAVYRRERAVFEDGGDEGEVWFGGACERRVLRWMTQHVDSNQLILDIGCGNGHMMTALRDASFAGVDGMDYSLEALHHAMAVLSAHHLPYTVECLGDCPCDTMPGQRLWHGDLLDTAAMARVARVLGTYNVLHDKGTFDAVCLSGIGAEDAAARYCAGLRALASGNAMLVITSCNWTCDELVRLFAPAGFALSAVIPHSATFSFGGALGQTVSSAVFRLP